MLKKYNVGILLFDYVDALDFTGPYEVFNVEIKPTFVAVVCSKARNCKRLNKTTPVTPMKKISVDVS